MVEKHNGRIAFVSELGVGTTFYFDIPEFITNQTPQELRGVVKRSSQRILICEDDPDIGSLLRIILAKSGFDADVAGSSQEGKELVTKNKYVDRELDSMMRDRNGVNWSEEVVDNL